MQKNSKNDFNQAASLGTAFYYKNEIPYTAIPKYYLKDKFISLKAKGLLTIIYSLPEEWEYNMKGLAKVANLTIKQLRPILKELIDNRYILRERKQNKYNGTFYYEYWIHFEPYFTEFELRDSWDNYEEE